MDGTSSSNGSSATTAQLLTSNPSNDQTMKPEFNPGNCLFCNQNADDLDSSLHHMQKAHGLFIPDKDHLIVDAETLIQYLHLVIFGYNECIWCGTARASPEAIQQHMTGKGHCRFDIAGEDSEYADFYDFSDREEDDDDDNDDGSNAEGKKATKISLGRLVQPEDGSLRLPSGKIISNRSSASTTNPNRPSHHRSSRVQPQIKDITDTTPGASSEQPEGAITTTKSLVPASSGPSAIVRREKQETALNAQLARLNSKDRMSLAHLPASEQRAVLATQQKQMEKARRLERRYKSRVEGLGNKTLMKHFVPDTPGRTNG